MSATLELNTGATRLVLAPAIGGAIASFHRGDDPVLRPASSRALAEGDVRQLASYPLIPFSNRIANATLHWAGATYPLPRYLAGHPHAIHGNGWQREWQVAEQTPTRATLELVHDAMASRKLEWPFPYRARQMFDLTDDALALTMTIENTGTLTFPFGLGWHPFFPRTATTLLQFSADGVWQTDATTLPTRREPVPLAWDFSTPRAIADTTLDHCFADWRSPAGVRWRERRMAVSIAADPACSHLVVYVPRDSDHLAIEPVTHMTDAFNRADAGQADTGTRVLAPGQTFSCTMRLSVSTLSDDAGV